MPHRKHILAVIILRETSRHLRDRILSPKKPIKKTIYSIKVKQAFQTKVAKNERDPALQAHFHQFITK